MTGFLLLALVLSCCTYCGKKEETVELQSLSSDEEQKENLDEEQAGFVETDQEEEDTDIYVYVCGAVHFPGVYALARGSRVYEAVALAGGIREDGAAEYVNQAQKISDGEKIYIPTETEVQEGSFEIEEGAELFSEHEKDTENDGKVNLNTASEEELQTLSGIGETRAKSIIEYRENNGGFQSIEDLMKVEGIKEGVFEKIKDRITVNAGS